MVSAAGMRTLCALLSTSLAMVRPELSPRSRPRLRSCAALYPLIGHAKPASARCAEHTAYIYASLSSGCNTRSRTQGAKSPHIVLIVSDDLGEH